MGHRSVHTAKWCISNYTNLTQSQITNQYVLPVMLAVLLLL